MTEPLPATIAAPPAERARRAWWALALLALPTVLVAVDLNVVFLALPSLAVDLGASGVEQLWISDVYGFLVAGLVITMGTLGDRLGRRRLLLAGAAGFAAASVLAAVAPTAGVLIAARALQGAAGATLMPSTLSLITVLFPDPRRRGTAISIWATCTFAGAALGPVAGGVLLEHASWRVLFLPAVPVAAALVGGRALLPEHRTAATGRLDLASVALCLAAVLPVVGGVKLLAAGGGTPVAVALLVGGVGAAVVFVRRQLTVDGPLLELRLLRCGPVPVVLAAMVSCGVVMAGTGLVVTGYLQTALGLDPARAAAVFAPMGLGVAAGTLLTPLVVRRVPAFRLIPGGLALAAVGALLLVAGTPGAVVVGITVLAFGTGPLFALGTGTVLSSVPSERAGSAAALGEVANHLGVALGTAVLGSVAVAVYRRVLDASPALHALPPAVAARVSDSPSAGRALASGELLDAVVRATSAGPAVVGGIGAVVLVVLAVGVARRGAPATYTRAASSTPSRVSRRSCSANDGAAHR